MKQILQNRFLVNYLMRLKIVNLYAKQEEKLVSSECSLLRDHGTFTGAT